MRIITVIGGILTTVAFFFAVIFALASSYTGPGMTAQTTQARLLVSIILFIIGLAIIVGIYFITRKPKTVIQRVEIAGQIKASQIKCPNCGASINTEKIKIIQGTPHAECPYCGTPFEVTEEPKW